MRFLWVVGVCLLVGGCAMQRAQVAQDARVSMVGLSKERVLACMGPPAAKAAEGATEVWSYDSGNGMQVADISGDRYGATAISTRRFCKVNVVMVGGAVSTVNYSGPTGGLLSAGEQCAYAVERCAAQR
jgi:hypothetical protein